MAGRILIPCECQPRCIPSADKVFALFVKRLSVIGGTPIYRQRGIRHLPRGNGPASVHGVVIFRSLCAPGEIGRGQVHHRRVGAGVCPHCVRDRIGDDLQRCIPIVAAHIVDRQPTAGLIVDSAVIGSGRVCHALIVGPGIAVAGAAPKRGAGEALGSNAPGDGHFTVAGFTLIFPAVIFLIRQDSGCGVAAGILSGGRPLQLIQISLCHADLGRARHVLQAGSRLRDGHLLLQNHRLHILDGLRGIVVLCDGDVQGICPCVGIGSKFVSAGGPIVLDMFLPLAVRPGNGAVHRQARQPHGVLRCRCPVFRPDQLNPRLDGVLDDPVAVGDRHRAVFVVCHSVAVSCGAVVLVHHIQSGIIGEGGPHLPVIADVFRGPVRILRLPCLCIRVPIFNDCGPGVDAVRALQHSGCCGFSHIALYRFQRHAPQVQRRPLHRHRNGQSALPRFGHADRIDGLSLDLNFRRVHRQKGRRCINLIRPSDAELPADALQLAVQGADGLSCHAFQRDAGDGELQRRIRIIASIVVPGVDACIDQRGGRSFGNVRIFSFLILPLVAGRFFSRFAGIVRVAALGLRSSRAALPLAVPIKIPVVFAGCRHRLPGPPLVAQSCDRDGCRQADRFAVLGDAHQCIGILIISLFLALWVLMACQHHGGQIPLIAVAAVKQAGDRLVRRMEGGSRRILIRNAGAAVRSNGDGGIRI